MITIITEAWAYITDIVVPNVDFERYMVSTFGRVYDRASISFVSIVKDDEGYNRVHIHTSNGFKLVYLHRLVKIQFEGLDPDPIKNQVDHKDCNKDNNYIGNLEWVTKAENALRAIDNGLYTQFSVKLTEGDVHYICQMLKNGCSYKKISDSLYSKYNQDTTGMIGKIYRGERWKHISKQYIPFPPLKKEKIIPSNAALNEDMVHEICQLLSSGKRIVDVAKLIETKYGISKSLENTVGMIKRGRSWTDISSKYNIG